MPDKRAAPFIRKGKWKFMKRGNYSQKLSRQALDQDAYNAEQSEKYFQQIGNKKHLASVYLLQVNGPEGIYYKIGHTTTSVYHRFRWSSIPNYSVLCETNLSLYDAQQLEITLQRAFTKKRWWPVTDFGGRSECFRLDDSDIAWVRHVFLMTNQL